MSSKVKYIFLVLLLPLLGLTADSTRLKFQHFRLEDGLSQNSVSCITQDKKGYMWFGTRDGLNKFDGYQFKIFKTNPFDSAGLTENQINSLVTDNHGLIWIGCASTGLNVLDPALETFTHYRHDSTDNTSLSSDYINVIFKRNDGSIWIGTEKGLNKFNFKTKKFERYYFARGDSPDADIVLSLVEDGHGVLWVGTNDGLFRMPPSGKIERFRSDKYNPFTIPSNYISALEYDPRGYLWVGTDQGLSKYSYKTGKFITYKHSFGNMESLRDDNVQSILYVPGFSEGAIWVGTRDGGLNIFNERTEGFTKFRKAIRDYLTLGSNNILTFYIDRTGGVWIGTKGGGVSRHNNSFFQYVMPNAMIWSILESSAGVLWVGTEEGLYRFEKETGKVRIFLPSIMLNTIGFSSVSAVGEDNNGNIWLGGALGGLDIYNPKANYFKHVDLRKRLGIETNKLRVRAILRDSKNNMWIASTNYGLIKYDWKAEKFVRFYGADNYGMNSGKILSLYEDKDGMIWFGAFGEGLTKLNPHTKKIERFRNNPKDKNSLNDNSVLSIYEDDKGCMWFGTYNGLNKYDKKIGGFKHYTEHDGLPNNVVYAISGDKNGNIWASTNNGLALINREKGPVANFNVNNGLLSPEFNANAVFKSQDGKLYFGSIAGIAYFDPDSIFLQKPPPPPQIVKFSISGKEALSEDDILRNGKIEISYKDKYISFEFLSLDYDNIDKLQYAYKLEGFDKDWVYCGSRRSAFYTNLNGGDYTFKVRVYNSGIHSAPKETSVRLSITPPFYSTWPFRIALALAIMFALYAFLKYKVRNVERQNKNLAQTVEEKTRLFNEISILNYNLEEEIKERERTQHALKDSEERMRNLVENQGEGIVVADENENFTFVNPAAEDIFGVPSGKLLGRNMREFVFDEEFKKLMYQSNLRATGQKSAYEISIVRTDGQKRDLHITATPNFDDNGRFNGSFGVIMDITERKRIERALIESENRFRVASETSPFVIFIYRDNKIIYVNSAAEMVTGYTKAELMDLNFWDIVHPDFQEQVKKLGYLRQRNEPTPQRYEFKIMRKDGIERWIDFSGSYIEIQGLPAALGAAVDINDRKVYEQEIEQLSQFMNLAVDNINVWFHVSDVNLNIVVWNKAAEIHTGYSSSEVSGSNEIWDCLSPIPGNSDIKNMMSGLLEKIGSVDDYETLIKSKSGEEKLISWNAKSLTNNEGEIIGIAAFGRDVTIKKKYEMQLVEAKEIAERSNRLKSEFLAQMSHEIRSPINIILSFASLLKEEMNENISDELKIGFESIEKGGQRIIRTVDMILNMSEITSGYFETNPVPLDLQDGILHDLMDEYIPAAKRKGLRILYENSADNRMIMADVFSVTQIFSNLIDNAIKYTENGYVKIKLYNEPGKLCAVIKDTGIGIKKEYIPQLFDPFTQEEGGYTRKFDGNGLGLALVKKYCSLNNAVISVESEKGKGSAFTIKFSLID